jgi:signal transduction histidine kinase/DNA-binding response OmpR family regulator
MRRTILFICSILFALFTLNAKENLIDSLETVLSKADNSEDSIRILCQLAWNSSSTDTGKTFFYGSKALSKVKGSETALVISEAYDAAALGFWVKQDFKKAKQYYKKSLQIGEKNHLPERIAWCNYNLAQIEMNAGQHDSVIIYSQKSMNAFEEAGMTDMMMNSFWLLIKVSGYDLREQICQKMISRIEKIIPSTKDLNSLTFRYLDISKIYNLLEKKSKSLEYVLKALEIAEKNKDEKGITIAYTSIGAYLRDVQHNNRVAIQYYERILETYRKYNNTWGITETLNEIGAAYMEMGNDSLALVYFSENLSIAEKIDSRYYISEAHKLMGEIYYRRGDYKKALELFNLSNGIDCKGCGSIHPHEILIQLGNTYTKLGEANKAKFYYLKSYYLADSLQYNEYKSISLISLGNWYKDSNDILNATKKYAEAFENAIKTNNLNLQVKVSDLLSDIYSVQASFRNAYKYTHFSKTLQDSIRKMNESENLTRVETLFEFENLRMQREVEKTKAEAEIGKQVLTRNLFLGGFIIMSILGFFLLVSFRKMKKANILLKEQKKKIEEMSEKIHKTDKLKLDFFTNISHELRTPLTLITGLTDELAKQQSVDGKWKNQITIIRKNTSKLLLLVNQILDIRKLENGDSTVDMVNDDLVKFVAGIVTLFEDYARSKNIELKFVSENNSMMAEADYGKLDKIISNLLSNAIKFCSNDDHVRVTLYTEMNPRQMFVIEVTDTGKGIPEEQLQYVFQPFYQVNGSDGGSGIGLALIRELVNLLDGQINIESKLTMGTRVTVKIPYNHDQHDKRQSSSHTVNDEVQEIHVEGSSRNQEDENIKNPVSENGYERTLLIVEDNPDLLDYIEGILLDEFKVLKAENGIEGQALALKHIPDIIVSDIMMPKMDGYQLCEALKNNPYTSHIPILMLTAKTDQDSMLQSFKIGADDYIIKPFSAVLLKSRIQNLVNQRRKLIEKFSRQFQFEPSEVLLPDADKSFLEKVIKVIESHIDDPELNIDTLAFAMNVSRTQLYRKLKALTDYSGNQFIRIIRLKRAAQLLEQHQLNITEVMQKTGFSNYSYFNQCFKEQFGHFPKEYAGSRHSAN